MTEGEETDSQSLMEQIREAVPKHIRFAPLNIPLERRLQMLAVLFHTIALPYCIGIFFLFASFPPFWPLAFVYIIYICFIDKTSENGEIFRTRSPLIRRLPIFRLYCDYFPITIHREVELEPSFPNQLVEPSGRYERLIMKIFGVPEPVVVGPNNVCAERESQSPNTSRTPTEQNSNIGPRYVFGYHPHGIVSLGAFGAIGTEGAGWERLFRGIPVSLLTLESNFKLPFYRDYLLSLGISSVSRKSCSSLLKLNRSICIVVGGARESLLAEPGRLDLIISKRRGFVRLAMQSLPPAGAPPTCLVPILSFGENDVYEQIRGNETSKLWKIQNFIKKITGFTLPLLHARGVFNYDWGLMPYRRPITLVVGKPIHVPYISHPTESEIDVYHEQYCKELRRLWDTYKSQYQIDYSGMGLDSMKMNFVE
ncbi:diacylglycerol acyltransferase-domain-containing protein [Lipomyces oligophaga]|uniref:diacylglycerol acyltransferase-domain-containing protein n=1 Tax=Lipomyces oligophaga TaxID=45792 RepID=UPI0034CEDCCF